MVNSGFHDEINDIVASRTDELVEMLQSFIAVSSENPPGTGLREAQNWIVEKLSGYGIPYEIHDTARTDTDHAVIIGRVGEDGEPFLYMHGHYDVVPAFSPEQFHPRISDGSVYGRGASDMKSGVVGMLLATVVHRDLGGAGQVRLVYVPDEETGGADGSERMSDLGLVDPIGCLGAIVGEPSYPDIWYAARGAFTVKVTVNGKPAHVGLHYTGVNAFERAHRVVSRLWSWRDTVASHKTDFRIEPEAARASIALIGGVSGGGTNFNIVPDEFSFTIDRRPNPDEDYNEVRQDLLDLLDELAEEDELRVEVLQDARPASTPPDHDLVKVLQGNIARVRGRHASLSMCPGCLETRIYSQHGIPALAYGPGPTSAMHAPEEHVPTSNLVEACAVYASVLGDTLGYGPERPTS
jgi:acetylornithine deacetylase/succinyl-diaminopimelate desuccinylase family protein